MKVRFADDRIEFIDAYDQKDELKLVGCLWDADRYIWHIKDTPMARRALLALPCVSGSQDLVEVLTPGNGQDKPREHITSKRPGWSHQLAVYERITSEQRLVMHWDMGAGKTKPVVDFVANEQPEHVLVVCPKQVIDVWVGEFEKHAEPQVNHIVKLGAPLNSPDAARMLANRLHYPAAPKVFIVNYDRVWRGQLGQQIKKQYWDLLVMDELHRIKAAAGKASMFLGRQVKARRRLGLTGTLMPHSPLDVYAQFRAIDPNVLGTSNARFKLRYATTDFWGHVDGCQNLDELRSRIAPFVDRVRKEDVLDLPPVMHQRVTVELDAEEQKRYLTMERNLVAEVKGGVTTASNALSKLIRLDQITCGFLPRLTELDDGTEVADLDTFGYSKAHALRDLLEDLPNEPVVVFCRFKHDLEMVSKICEGFATATEPARVCYELSGNANDLAKWQNDCGNAVLAVQIQTGREGIDLTRARYAVYFSIGYSLGDYEQSLARTHRPGQTRKVCYYHLVGKGTVDEKKYGALQAKKNLIEVVLAGLKGSADK